MQHAPPHLEAVLTSAVWVAGVPKRPVPSAPTPVLAPAPNQAAGADGARATGVTQFRPRHVGRPFLGPLGAGGGGTLTFRGGGGCILGGWWGSSQARELGRGPRGAVRALRAFCQWRERPIQQRALSLSFYLAHSLALSAARPPVDTCNQ